MQIDKSRPNVSNEPSIVQKNFELASISRYDVWMNRGKSTEIEHFIKGTDYRA